MNNTKRHFEFKDDKSAKFWEITQASETITVRYGKIGTSGQTQEKAFADAASAGKHVAKLIAEKLGKGYIEQGSSSATGDETPAAPKVSIGNAPKPSAELDAQKVPAKSSKPKNPAQDPEAAPESLMALMDKDDATNRLLAKHPRASVELLEKLSHSSDQATRKLVCLHPNASKDVLIRLAPQFPGDFFLNPAFDWLLMEDPDLLFKLGKGVLKNILKRPDCPLSFIQWAVKRGSEQEQLALAMNPNTPKDIIKALSQRKGALGDAAKGRSTVPGGSNAVSQEELEDRYKLEVKKAIGEVKPEDVASAFKRGMITSAQRPWLNLECRLLLDDIPLSLAVIGAMKGREQELAAHANPEVRAWVARFKEGGRTVLASLAVDSNPNVRAAVAANPHCADADFLRLLGDKLPAVRAAAAQNFKISADQAAAMAADPSPTVREAACAAWCIPVQALQVLAQERLVAFRKVAAARLESMSKPGGSPATTPEELGKIAESAKVETKRLLAANPSTPVTWLQQFAKDGNTALDKALLENPRLPSDLADAVYRRVLENLGPLQRISFLERPGTPREIRELAGQKAWQSKWPECQDWLKEAYEFMYAPWTGHGEEALLNIPSGLESAYAGSMLRSARLLGLAHPRVPPELLIKRSKSEDWAERLAIARNTSLPPNMVAKFQKDSHRLVAAQALATETSKSHIKDRQQDVLSQAPSPVDWNPIVEGIRHEIATKGVRPWECFGTPWWPHLKLHERLGLPPLSRTNSQLEWDKLNLEPLEPFFSTSPFDLHRLLACQSDEIRVWLAGFNKTPLGFLETLFANQVNHSAQKNWLSRVNLEESPDLPEKLRAAASKVQDDKWYPLRGELLRHPATPPDALLQIVKVVKNDWEARSYLREIALPKEARVVLQAVSPSEPFSPDWVDDPKAAIRKRAVAHPDVTVAILEQFQKDKNAEVRLLAELVLIDRLQMLLGDERSAKIQVLLKRVLGQSEGFKKEVSGLVGCPAEILEALSKGKDVWEFADDLAKNPSTPESALIRLAKLTRSSFGFQEDVTDVVCANPSATPTVFKALLQSKSAKVRARVVALKELPHEFLVGLERDSSPLVRSAIAQRKDTPPDVLAALALDLEIDVRLALAKSDLLPMELRVLLAKDKQAVVRNAALEGGSLPQAVYIDLIQAGERDLPDNCIIEIDDESILETLAREGVDYISLSGASSTHTAHSVKRKILKKTSISESVLTILAERAELRGSIAQRSDLTINLLESFANDSDVQVVAAALGNPLMPEGLMREVVLSRPSQKYWDAVFNNPFPPLDLLNEMTEKVDIPSYLAKSWFAKKMAGRSCEDQTNAFLVHATDLARNPNAPPEKLRMLAASGIWLIRWLVAFNQTLPEVERAHILEDLWSEVEEALWGQKPPLPSFDVLQEDGIRSALDRLDLMPPAQDKRALAAAAKSPEMLRRVAAVLSPGIQPSILKMLLEDPVDSVKALAAEKLHALESAA